ncbi:MAG: hypothetical protein ABJG88_09695 [Litorimonas sp.]
MTNLTSVSYAQDSDLDGIIDPIDLDDDNDGIIDTVENDAIKVDFSSAGDGDGGSLATWNQIFRVAGVPAGSVIRHRDGAVVPGVGININNFRAGRFNNDPNSSNWNGTANDPYYILAADDIYFHQLSTPGTISFTGLDTTLKYNVRIYNLIGNRADVVDTFMVTDGASTRTASNTRGAGWAATNLHDAGTVFENISATAAGRVTVTTPPPSVNAFPLNAIILEILNDFDGDGIPDLRDIDSDNDGITDNVEAQTTANYIVPSNAGGAFADSDNDGLDNAYEPNGLSPIDTDSDSTQDIFDNDSDNDGLLDIEERDDTGPTAITSVADTDNDGLLDIFEGSALNDNYIVNDENILGADFLLGDSDDDTDANGGNAVPLTQDLNYRDIFQVDIQLEKTVAVYDPENAGLFMLPGNDVIYTFSGSNEGDGPSDDGSIFLVDRLPPEIEFYNDDIDDSGPETGVIVFAQTDTNLTFTPSADLGFSNAATPPSSFAACNYTPLLGYDPNVTFLCLNPKGNLNSGTPSPSFSFQFRARIK